MTRHSTHLWATLPPEPGEELDVLEIRMFHRFGNVPEAVQVRMFDAAREVFAEWAAGREPRQVE